MPHEQVGEIARQLDEAGAMAVRSVHPLCNFPRELQPIDALIPIHSGYDIEQVTDSVQHLECKPVQGWDHASLCGSFIPCNEPIQLGHHKADMFPKGIRACMLQSHDTRPRLLAVHELDHFRAHIIPTCHVFAEDTRIQVLLCGIDVVGGQETLGHSGCEGLIAIGVCVVRLDVQNPPPSAQEAVLEAAGSHFLRCTRGCLNAENERPLAILNHSF
mmetsp:Transcript_23346/g.66507  ORF Transcript_23346/g.66507 Transcript_23346/m.66507 type:complete len:216 (-) Transcript_23346:140-787(-)